MSGAQVFRLEPKGRPEDYTTFSLRSRPAPRSRRVDCGPAGCEAHALGWQTRIDEGTAQGKAQAHYIRTDRSRKAVESREGGLTVFTFEPGQRCFREHWDHHQVAYRVRGGDWRGNPRQELRVHTRAQDWVEDFATTTQAVADRLARG